MDGDTPDTKYWERSAERRVVIDKFSGSNNSNAKIKRAKKAYGSLQGCRISQDDQG